jgi:GT2 family glycosyltransferase
VPRDTWERYGPFPEHLGGCEDTLLTNRLRADGLFVYAPEAAVVHHNRRRLRAMLAHQYELGAAHARLDELQGEAPAVPASRASRRVLRRIRYLYARLAEWAPRDLAKAVLLAPVVALGFGAWGLGLWRGGRRGDG